MLKKILKIAGLALGGLLLIFLAWYFLATPPREGDWQTQLAVPSAAEFNGDQVTVKNVRNFRYYPTEADMHPAYYDKTYDFSQLKRVWYVSEPFNENRLAAHTFLSFEFNNGDFLAITIEARKTKTQVYGIWKGIMRSYPLIYIASDERDVVMLRANLRKDKVYVYPVKLSSPENGRKLLVDMLERMNSLQTNPKWYNTLWANCTSSIAYHVNRITPGRVSMWNWRLWLTASADELALKAGLLDTDLPIEQARAKYQINEKSEAAGDVEGYERMIRGIN